MTPEEAIARAERTLQWRPGQAAVSVDVGVLTALVAVAREVAGLADFPRIVCLCGSTRFKAEFFNANFVETMAGRIVLSVGWFSHTDAAVYTPSPEEKARLDALHLRKIDLADEVLVIDVGGYIGSSTRGEISHAVATGKPVRYWSTESVYGRAALALAPAQFTSPMVRALPPVAFEWRHQCGAMLTTRDGEQTPQPCPVCGEERPIYWLLNSWLCPAE